MERGNVKSADSLGDLGCGEKNVKSLTQFESKKNDIVK